MPVTPARATNTKSAKNEKALGISRVFTVSMNLLTSMRYIVTCIILDVILD